MLVGGDELRGLPGMEGVLELGGEEKGFVARLRHVSWGCVLVACGGAYLVVVCLYRLLLMRV